tara:strand:+ start:194 stop:409 length:216 start_codon:yes stop_codon:yes gene_type:complete
MDYKVLGHSTLMKNGRTQAVFNKDTSAYSSYMKRIKEAKKSNDDLRCALRDINIIKSEMHEIKDILKKLVT